MDDRYQSGHRPLGYGGYSFIPLGESSAVTPGHGNRILSLGSLDISDSRSRPCPPIRSHEHSSAGPSLPRTDEHSKLINPPDTIRGSPMTNDCTPSFYNTTQSRPAPAASTSHTINKITPGKHPCYAAPSHINSKEPRINPLASVGDQFSHVYNLTGFDHTAHCPKSNSEHSQPLTRSYNSPATSMRQQIYNGLPIGASYGNVGGPPGLPPHTLGNDSYTQRTQSLEYNGALPYSANCRIKGEPHYAINETLESTEFGFTGDNRRAQRPSRLPSKGDGDVTWPTAILEPCRYRIPHEVQGPVPRTSVSPASPTSSFGAFGIDNPRLTLPHHEPLPFSAFSVGEQAQFSTRNPNRSVSTPCTTAPSHNSADFLSPVLSVASSRQSSSSTTLSEASAICPHCGHVASRAAKVGDRKSNLQRHIREKHQRAGGLKHLCPEPGCGRAFERSDNVLRHRRKSHGVGSSPG